MNRHFRHFAASALLLLPAATTMLALPVAALAQPSGPELGSLQASADGRLEPGTLLTFQLEGTPRAQASIRIRGVDGAIGLRETSYGVYSGAYTLKRGDRIAPDSSVRVTLDDGYRTAAADYDLGELLPRSRAQSPVPRFIEPRIERFGIVPVERIEPGADIRFSLEGTPGATVTVDVAGVNNNIGLREVRPGAYEGGYTIRRSDNFDKNRPVVATLRIGDRVATSNVAFVAARQAVDNQSPTVKFLDPAEGQVVAAGPSVHIAATFDDAGGSGVDPASVRIVVSGRDITPQSQINRQTVSFWGALPPGRHIVEVTGRDLAGNAFRKSWAFEAAAAAVPVRVPAPAVQPAPTPFLVVPGPASLAIQVVNHAPNEEIGPDPALVAARTAPNALVTVRVQAFPPPTVAAQPRLIFSQTLQANREGVVSFTMVPGTPYPGERYEILMAVIQGGVRGPESRFTLIQRQNN